MKEKESFKQRTSTFMKNDDEEQDSFFPEANEEQILGLVWSKTYKNDKNQLPSMNEIIKGLYEHVSKYIE